MTIEILYRSLYDYTTESYHRETNRTETVKINSVVWNGETDYIEQIEAAEKDFLTQVQPTTSPNSWDHRNFRIEVYGLRIGGAKGKIFNAVDPDRISQQLT